MRGIELMEKIFRSFMSNCNAREIHVKCETLNEACNICKALDKIGFLWCDGDPLTYLEDLRDEWEEYKERGVGDFYMLIDYREIKIAIDTQDAESVEIVSVDYEEKEEFKNEYDCDFEIPNKYLTYSIAMNMLKEVRKELRNG